jgi:hypothetical protein
MALAMGDYMTFRNQHSQLRTHESKNQSWDIWTPRWEDVEIEAEEQVPVKVYLEEFGDVYDWILRKGLEWPDLRYLVNSKLGHDNWESFTNDFIWDGEKVNGMIYRPSPGQEIKISASWMGRSEKKMETFKQKQTTWDRISTRLQNYDDWH